MGVSEKSTVRQRFSWRAFFSFIYSFIFDIRQAGPVQLSGWLEWGLYKQKGQATQPEATFPTLCEKCIRSLTSPVNQYREDAEHEAYSLLPLSKKTRMSNHLQMS